MAPPELLRAEGAALAERSGARSLSLVNLRVTYDLSSFWDRALLRDVESGAREAGWRTSRLRKDGAAGEADSQAQKQLFILSPVQARYYPG